MLFDALLPPPQDHTPIGCHSFNRWPFVDHGCSTCPKAILSSFPRHRPVGSHFFNKCPVVDHCCLTQVFFHPKTTHQLVAILSTSAHLSITVARQLSKGKLSSFPRPTGQLEVMFSTGVLLSVIAVGRNSSPPKTHKPGGCRFVNKCPLLITAARPIPPDPQQCPGPHTNWLPFLSTGAPSSVAVGRPVQRQFALRSPDPQTKRLSFFSRSPVVDHGCVASPQAMLPSSQDPQTFTCGELRCSVGFALIHRGTTMFRWLCSHPQAGGLRWLEILDPSKLDPYECCDKHPGRRRPGRRRSGPKSSKLFLPNWIPPNVAANALGGAALVPILETVLSSSTRSL